MTGRAMIYMGTVSSALIAFGFLAPTADLAPFVAGVLPALLLFGELTFAALLRNTVENVVLLRQVDAERRARRHAVAARTGDPSLTARRIGRGAARPR
jgi:hypothetical protein